MPIFLLFVLGITWSLGYAIVRYCVVHGVHPLGYAFWQSLGPAIVLTIFCVITKKNIANDWRSLRFYGVASLLGIAIPNSVMYFSAGHLPSGIVAVVTNTAPMMTYVLSLLLRVEHFRFVRLFGVLLAVIGIYCIAMPNTLSSLGDMRWVLTALITPLCFASCAVYISHYQPKNSDSLVLATGMLWGASLWLSLILLSAGSYFYPISFPFTASMGLIFVEIALSSLGYYLFFQLLKKAGPVYYSLVAGVVAVAGLFFGWLFFQESFQFTAIVGMVFVVLGIVLVSV